MLLTSSAYIGPLSALWRLGDTQELLYNLPDDLYVNFANLTTDLLIGTNGQIATVSNSLGIEQITRCSKSLDRF